MIVVCESLSLSSESGLWTARLCSPLTDRPTFKNAAMVSLLSVEKPRYVVGQKYDLLLED